MPVTNQELAKKALSVARPRRIKHGFKIGEVGSALVTDKGHVYVGANIDTSSGMGFCAEHSAMAAMVTQGEYRIKKIVAVLSDGKVVPPCGRCRELIHQIHYDNMETEVILGKDRTVKLRTLLPYVWDERK